MKSPGKKEQIIDGDFYSAFLPNIEFIDIEQLHVDKNNPNNMSDKKYYSLRRSIEYFQFMYPIVVDSDYLIADGEHRLYAAKELGMKKVPVIRLSLKDADRRILRQVLNKIRGEHDFDLDCLEYEKIIQAGQDEALKELIDLSEFEKKRYLVNAEVEMENGDYNSQKPLLKYTKCPNCSYEFNPSNFMAPSPVKIQEPETDTNVFSLGRDEPLEKQNKISMNLSLTTRQSKVSNETIAVAQAFGVGIDETIRTRIFEDFEICYNDRDLIYVTGDSGSGKSSFLRLLSNHELSRERKVMRFSQVKPCNDEILVEGMGSSVEENMRFLGLVGLSEASIMVRRFDELSEGQKYRYKLAKMIREPADAYIVDEFASTLDRITAKVLAFNVQKWARKMGKMVAIATPHQDLVTDFNPNILVYKGFGETAQIHYFDAEETEASIMGQISLQKAIFEDYIELGQFHYINDKPSFFTSLYKLVFQQKIIGIIVYSSPFLRISLRNRALPRYRSANPQTVNRDIVRISRVIIHPKFRGIGLGKKLVKETIPLTKAKVVEVVAAMGIYNPFFEKAGMTYVGNLPIPREGRRLIKTIKELGGVPALMHSQIERIKFIEGLSTGEKNRLTDALIKSYESHQRQFGRGINEAKRMFREFAHFGLETLLKNMIPVERAYLYWINPERSSSEYMTILRNKPGDT